MKKYFFACGTVLVLLAAVQVQAQTSPASDSERMIRGVPIEEIIEKVAKKTSKKFIIDPRVRAQVQLVGPDVANVDYRELQTILEVHNFAAVDAGGYIRVIPVADSRNIPVPTVTGSKEYADSEVVSKVIAVKSVPAAGMLQALRPIIPNYAHLGVVACTNMLVVVDRYANVKRVSALIEAMDKGEPLKLRSCGALEEPSK